MAKLHNKRTILSVSIKKFIDDYMYRIDLDADYQREKIWSRSNQEALLDSIIQNIDVPKIYLAEVKDDEQFDYECIDGKQRMTTLLNFYKPEEGLDPLSVAIKGERYSYDRLKSELSQLAKKIDDFDLTLVIYENIEREEFIREIFRRLQLGISLNSGELLKTFTGAMRNFVYKDIGSEGPFLRHTKLSKKRFSREFTLAQICINSFARTSGDTFVRARYEDLADFFKENYALKKNDSNFARVKEILNIMDSAFGLNAEHISSRAVAVTAYLFIEDLYKNKARLSTISLFAKFYVKLLEKIAENADLLAAMERPKNRTIMEEFQKYISQASVEPYSIERRHTFLANAFEYYLSPKTKGKIIGDK